MNIQSGYCTNVHAGASWQQTWANLQRFAPAVRRHAFGDAPMGIGLWLSAGAARQLVEENRVDELAGWLRDQKLIPFTFNGFPYGDFHQKVVKHLVYLPTWFDRDRADYTRILIGILHRLLPAGMEGSISTLPIAWAQPAPADLARAGQNLAAIADHLAHLEQTTGRLIYLSIEPEPGCYLQRGGDIIRFFQEHLLPGRDEAKIRRHLRVCHDICHASVMFEEQEEVLEGFRRAGIEVGKFQVSSAVRVPLPRLPKEQRAAALQQLSEFREERYLHQTMIRADASKPAEFFEDLDRALASKHFNDQTGEWRTHLHVPIYLERFGLLEGMQDAILSCLRWARKNSSCQHFEVETYAWGVLPADLQQPDLAIGIANEMTWFTKTWQTLRP